MVRDKTLASQLVESNWRNDYLPRYSDKHLVDISVDTHDLYYMIGFKAQEPILL